MKLIILQGPPACGKSTWVEEFLNSVGDQRDHYVVVSRDTIRQGTGTYWVPSREDYISILEDTAMEEALSRGINVINDATNLNPKTIQHLKDIAEKYSAEVLFIPLYVPFKTAIARDIERGKNGNVSVGKKVIENFYKRYFPNEFADEMYTDKRFVLPIEPNKPNAVICDLDGTVAIHRSGRSPYDYERVEEDEALRPMVLTLRALADGGVNIIFLSGREDVGECLSKTRRWINANVMGTRPYQIYLRVKDDHRKGHIIKKELYKEYIENNYNIINVFEDDPKCVSMWRQNGLQCSQTYDFDQELNTV